MGPCLKYVVDAHALIWNLEGNPKLGPRARAALAAVDSPLFVPSIALAEACLAVAKGRTGIADWRTVINAVKKDPRVRVVPLDLEIVEIAMSLPATLELHDGQIVATTIRLRNLRGTPVQLLTFDRMITQSGLVPILW